MAISTSTADRIFFRWIFPVLLLGVFASYVVHRQKYIGATDWYGYYEQGELLKGGHIELPVEFPAAEFPSIAPMGFLAVGNRVMPQYPPGFPLLLAAGHLLGAPLLVTPVVGLISCILMFFAMRDLADRWSAAALTLVWAFHPSVVFGSTTVMSDLVAATGILGAYWAYRRGQLMLSAWILGFSFCVRPTNVLFLGAFTIPLLRDRNLLRYFLYLAPPALLYGVYNQAVYGSPFRTGYGDFRSDFLPDVFPQHFLFYLGQALWQGTPVLVALALWGAWSRGRDSLFFIVWFASFLLLYSFWRSGGDRWWWSRFLLPGFPAFFFLAASGLSRLRQRLVRPDGPAAWRQPAVIGAFMAVLALPVFEIQFGRSEKDLWLRDKGHDYYDVVRSVTALVPAGSMVGSLEFTGSFRLYSDLTSFVSTYSTTPNLVAEGLRRGRRVFLVVESWNLHDDVVKRMFAQFAMRRIGKIETWNGVSVYEVRPRDPTAAAAGGKPRN